MKTFRSMMTMKTLYMTIPFFFFQLVVVNASDNIEGTMVKGSSGVNLPGNSMLFPVTPAEVDYFEYAPEPVITLKSLIPVVPEEANATDEVEPIQEIRLMDLSPVYPDGIEEVEPNAIEETPNLISLIPLHPGTVR